MRLSEGEGEVEVDDRRTRWRAGAFVAFLSLIVTLTSLRNGFALDDVHIIFENARVHTLDSFWNLFSDTYWPPEEGASLYRPLTMLAFAAQWVAGNGSPLAFHITSALLYAATCVAFYLLVLEFLPVAASAIIASVFVVHPVHVEVFANVVGQAEMWVALVLFLATRHWIRRRRAGTFGVRDSIDFAIIYFVACMFKEHAIILPALLLAADLTLFPSRLKERARVLAPSMILMAVAAVLFVVLRTHVIGRFAGAGSNGLLAISSFDVRVWTALSVCIEWVRLLMWPSQLSADYSYRRLDVSSSFEPIMLASVAVIVAVALLAWRARRTHPVFTFGVAWAGFTLLIPSNLVIMTGFMLAERALFLASAGVLICAGAAGVYLWRIAQQGEIRIRPVLAAATVLVLAAGASRSMTRAPVWADNDRLFRETVNDAPLSYRAHWMLAEHLLQKGPNKEGLDEMLLAVVLARKNDSYVLAFAADRFREASRCRVALGMYRKALAIRPEASDVRAGTSLCLIALGRSREAQTLALAGMKSKQPEPVLAGIVTYTDSVLGTRH